jgi:hypothetical protein
MNYFMNDLLATSTNNKETYSFLYIDRDLHEYCILQLLFLKFSLILQIIL